MVTIEDGHRPFPNLPKSLGAIIFPWAIALGILYFDFISNQQTNPIVVYTIPLIFMLIFMPKDNWPNIKKALCIGIETLRDKLVALMAALGGIILGWGMYQFIVVRAAIIPLYFPPFLAITGVSEVFILMGVVSIFEEFFVVIFAKISGNFLFSRFGVLGIPGIFGGIIIARAFWSSLHYFSYGAFTGGLETLPLFVTAWSLGLLFSTLAIGTGIITGKKYLTIGGITAHWTFNMMVALFLMILI